QLFARGQPVPPGSFCEEVAGAIEAYEGSLARMIRGLPGLLSKAPERAVETIARSGVEGWEFDAPIITPFVIPTVLASLWCVLRHLDSWPTAVSTAIRLGGDVDTLGAIVGALMGARLGLAAIPRHLVEAVVDSERLQGLALRYHALVVGEV